MKEIILAFIASITPIVITEKDVATQLTTLLISLSIIRFDGFTPYLKLKTHWQKISRKDLPTIIRNLISATDRSKVKSSHIAEAIKRISEDISLKIDIQKAFLKQQNLINFKNGVLDILTGGFDTDRTDYIFDYVLDGNYLPSCRECDAENFMKFIASSAGQDNYECIIRSIGYAISSRTDAKAGIFFVGPSGGGKSTLLKVISSAFSPELVSNVSFSQLTDPHYVIQLLGKKLNISYDNSPKPMDNEDVFKSVTSCEEIMGRELYESPVVFRPTVKLIFASNYPFNFKNPDDAIYNRMIVIPFEHSIDPKKQDHKLLDKMLGERDIIFSLAAKALKHLINSNFDFEMSEKGKAYISSKLTALHAVEDFLEDYTVLDESGTISAAELYSKLVEWCSANALTSVDKNTCKERVLSYAPTITYKKIGPREKRVWGYKGLRFKTPDELTGAQND